MAKKTITNGQIKDPTKFTRTEQAMWDILQDGLPHTYAELKSCCGPSSRNNLAVHIHMIRKKIERRGLMINCVWAKRKRMYQLVRAVYSANNGRT